MSGTVVKARQVRLDGPHWLDTEARVEVQAGMGTSRQSLQALQVFRRRIESHKQENSSLKEDLNQLRLLHEQRMTASRDEGFAAGVDEGRRQVEEELVEAFRLLADQEREFRRAARDYHVDADRELVKMARWMAETVLQRVLPLDEDQLARQVGSLLEAHLDHQVLRLHLHPGDHRRLTGPDMLQRNPRLAELLDSLRGRLEWVQAADVPPGACRVALHDGLLDATPAGMLDHLQQGVTRALLVGAEAGGKNSGDESAQTESEAT